MYRKIFRRQIGRQLVGLFALFWLGFCTAQDMPIPADASPTALATTIDPARFMQGFPPPASYQINPTNWQGYPQKIWSYQHMRELFPSRRLARGTSVSQLPQALLPLDSLIVSKPGEPAMTWPQMLAATHTDAIVVLHHGKVIDERYFNGMMPDTRHLLYSATKSMTGLMAATLVAEGRLDPEAKVGTLLPELAASAWANATVRQVMDMTDGVTFTENYTDASSDVFRYVAAMGWAPQLSNGKDPTGIIAMLATLHKQNDQPGTAFHYRSPATDVTAWLAMRASGQTVTTWLHDRLWSRLGVEQDGDFLLDPVGTEVAFAGLNLTARDLARVGQMLLQRGSADGQQLLPPAVIDDLIRGGDTEVFKKGGFATRSGWSYRSQWWVNPQEPRSIAALGAFGQMLYVFPDAELVIAKFSSHPQASNSLTDPIHQRAFATLIRHLNPTRLNK